MFAKSDPSRKKKPSVPSGLEHVHIFRSVDVDSPVRHIALTSTPASNTTSRHHRRPSTGETWSLPTSNGPESVEPVPCSSSHPILRESVWQGHTGLRQLLCQGADIRPQTMTKTTSDPKFLQAVFMTRCHTIRFNVNFRREGGCRCDVCDCGQDDSRKRVSEQGVQRITSKETAQT